MTELFENFEVNRESRTSMLLRLTGASLVLHVALMLVVIYVPAVRDTVNIAALIASAKLVDKDYVATQIGEDVQIVQLEKFRYPDGYWSPESQGFANPAVAGANDPFAPRIISQWRAGEPDVQETPSPSPDASPSASPGASPSALAGASPSASGSPAIAQNASPSPSASPLTQEEAQKELEKIAAQNNVALPEDNEINKKPLKDFAARANDLKNQGKLDLNKPFRIVIEAELDANAKLRNPRFVEKEGDENVVNLFGQLIAALNDSGFLKPLAVINKDNPNAILRITVKQGASEVEASMVSELTSPESAAAKAVALGSLLYSGAISRAGHDEGTLMKNTRVTPDGKKVVVNFSMPRQEVIDMIKKQMTPEPTPKPGA